MKTTLHNNTTLQINKYIKNSKSHAVLIEGKPDTDLSVAADYLATGLLGHKPSVSSSVIVSPDEKGSIGIASVKGLRRQLRHKGLDDNRVSFVVVVREADSMTIEAQNAFLKMLEEPLAHVRFILESNASTKLLGTVRSRIVNIEVLSPSLAQIEDLYSADFDEAEIKKAYAISGGSLSQIDDILRNKDESSYVASIEKAKKLLTSNRSGRLKIVSDFYKDRQSALAFIDALLKVESSIINAYTQKGHDLKGSLKKIQCTLEVREAISKNGNIKLQLDLLILNI